AACVLSRLSLSAGDADLAGDVPERSRAPRRLVLRLSGAAVSAASWPPPLACAGGLRPPGDPPGPHSALPRRPLAERRRRWAAAGRGAGADCGGARHVRPRSGARTIERARWF